MSSSESDQNHLVTAIQNTALGARALQQQSPTGVALRNECAIDLYKLLLFFSEPSLSSDTSESAQIIRRAVQEVPRLFPNLRVGTAGIRDRHYMEVLSTPVIRSEMSSTTSERINRALQGLPNVNSATEQLANR